MYKIGSKTTEYDSILQVWREKVRHDLVHPTTVIQKWGSDDLFTYNGDRTSAGPSTIKARDFQVFQRVMAHSEYPSATACLCESLVEFTERFFEGGRVPQGNTTTAPYPWAAKAGSKFDVTNPFLVSNSDVMTMRSLASIRLLPFNEEC